MKTLVVSIVFLLCALQTLYAQVDDGVVALDLPIRNSLTFNRYIVNPTFSFVREQNKYIAVYNKRQLLQLDDAPQTYMASFSGRLKENIGVGVGLFQENYGVLTTFGGLVNFAYNAALARESNLTFGVNVGAYKSGINSGKVITNFPDPSLNNIPSNFLLTISPGINYGSGFIDFGLTVNNLATYNFNSSKLLEDNPKQGIQGHLMYTGYLGSYGFFEDSKFSALGRAEFRNDTSIYSGTLMLTVPKGFWVQGGYNSVFGASGGIGLQITSQFAVEYNYEKALGGLADFGSSHEFTLAYKFENNDYFDYSSDDEIAGLISLEKKRKRITRKPKTATTTTDVSEVEALLDRGNAVKTQEETNSEAEEQARIAAEEQARLDAEERARLDVIVEAKLAEEEAAAEQARIAAEEQARLEAEERARMEAEVQVRLAAEAEAKAKAAAEEEARLAAAEQARIAAEEQARLEAEERARMEAEVQVRLAAEAEAKANAAAEEEARLAAEEQARLAAEEEARLAAEEQARLAAEEEARLAAEEQARIAVEEEARLAAEEKAKDTLVMNPTDELGSAIKLLVTQSEDSEKARTALLDRLSAAVENKDTALKDLKEENDLSEQGIYVAPKPFRSISEENQEIEDIKINLDEIIVTQSNKIKRLESLLEDRVKMVADLNDPTNLYYQNALVELKAEQQRAIRTRASLVSSLEEIAVATEFERKRRIKRAAYENENDRFMQDKNRLQFLKQNTPLSTTPLTVDDFDYGEELSNNIKILKNVENIENGYYLTMAVHSDAAKRDEFVKQVIASGHRDVNFFYDVNTSKYYIYYKKVGSIGQANDLLTLKGSEPYAEKLSIIKIEN